MAEANGDSPGPVLVAKPEEFTCGSLHYTKGSLFILSAWLIWGNVCFNMFENVGGPGILGGYLQDNFHVSNLTVNILTNMIPMLIGVFMTPIISFKSDRCRSRYGRRIPFMFFTIPFLCLFSVAIGYSGDIIAYCKATFNPDGFISPLTIGLIGIGFMAIGFAFFNEFVGTVYYYLCPDVMPRNFMGRFQGIAQIVFCVVGFFSSNFITPYSLTHIKALHVGVAILYFFGFGLMCWRVKEGEYPPVEDVKKETTTRDKINLYFKECFTHKIFIFFYASTAVLALTKGLNPQMVFGLHLNQHKARITAHPAAVTGQAHANRDQAVFACSNSGLVVNDEVTLRPASEKLPPTLSAKRHYYVINPTETGFQLAQAPGGAPIVLISTDIKKADQVPAEFDVAFAKIMPCPMAATPDCGLAVSGGGDGQVKVWELVKGKKTSLKELKACTDSGGPVFSVAIAANGKNVAAGEASGLIELWNIPGNATPESNDTPRKFEGHTREVKCLVFSKDGSRLVSASADKTIKLWDVSTGKCLNTLSGHEDTVNCVAFSSDEKRLVSGGSDKKIVVWDLADGKATKTIEGSPGPVNAVCFAPALEEKKDDRSFLTMPVAFVGQYLKDVFTNESLYDAPPDRTSKILGDDLWIVAGGQDGARLDEDSSLRIWDVNSGTLVGRPLVGHKGAIDSVAYKADIRAILTGSLDESVRLWQPTQVNDLTTQVASDQAFKQISGYTRAVSGIACQDHGVVMLNASEDGTLHVWDLDQGVSLLRNGRSGSFMALFSLLLAYPLGMLIDRWNPMKVALWTGVLGLPFTVAWFFFYHTYTFGFYMSIVRQPINMLAGYASMPLIIMILPKAKYGQFCSANALVRQAVAAFAGLGGAVFMDWLTTFSMDTDNFRWGFVFQAIAHALSLLALFFVYREWKKLGGDNYVAPEVVHEEPKPETEPEPVAAN